MKRRLYFTSPVTFRLFFTYFFFFILWGTAIRAQTAITLGSGTATTITSPVSPNVTNSHTQILYTAAEIQAKGITGARTLKGFGFYVQTAPTVPITNFTIKMRNTTAPDVSNYDPGQLDFVTVYSNASYMPQAGGFDTLNFTTDFSWNGTSNILVDICFSGGTLSTASQIRAYSPNPPNLTKYIAQNNASVCDIATSTVGAKPQCVMVFCCYNNDAEMISLPSPAVPFAADSQQVKIVFRNNSPASPLTSLKINWSVNDTIQPEYTWSGSLAPARLSDTVVIGTYKFRRGIQHRIKIWVSNPNNNPDMFNKNDTLLTIKRAGFEGVFTVGPGSQTDFKKLSEVITAMKEGGVIAPVTFKLRDTIFTEQVIITEIPGMSKTNTVTIQPAKPNDTTSILDYNSGYAVSLNGADYFIFKNMTFRMSGGGAVLSIQGGAHDNIFENNVFLGSKVSTTSSSYAVIMSNATIDSNNVFRNNKIYNGSYGFYYNGISAASPENGTVIEGNRFINQFYQYISLSNQYAPEIRKNVMTSASAYTSFYGIYLNNCLNKLKITENKIHLSDAGYGLYLTSCPGDFFDTSMVANNFITAGGATNTYGIFCQTSGFIKLCYNSVNLSTLNATSRVFYTDNSSSLVIMNNVFAHSGTGYSIYMNNTGSSVCNYNNLFSNGVNLANWMNSNKPTLADWQTASLLDSNSISVMPKFTSAIDLHTVSPDLDKKGKTVPGLMNDIDGQTRDAIPDIGADEYRIGPNARLISVLNPYNGQELAAGKPQNIIITLKNEGTDTLSNFPLSYSIDGNTAVTDTFRFSMPLHSDTLFIFSEAWIPDSGQHELCVRTLVDQDTYPEDDEQCITVFVGVNATGMEQESPLQTSVWIYPNPAGDHFTIRYTPGQPGSPTLTVSDMHGRTILSTGLEAGIHEARISLPPLSAGIYLCRLFVKDAVYTVPISVMQ